MIDWPKASKYMIFDPTQFQSDTTTRENLSLTEFLS